MTLRRRDVERRAASLGLRLTKGDYTGTSDDCAGRWYLEDAEAEMGDRRGGGLSTLADVMWELDMIQLGRS